MQAILIIAIIAITVIVVTAIISYTPTNKQIKRRIDLKKLGVQTNWDYLELIEYSNGSFKVINWDDTPIYGSKTG